MKKLSKKEIIDIVLQSDCPLQPDTVYRRIQRLGMTLEEALTLPARSRVATKRFYVYYLLDGDSIFYIGSGQGDRAYRHCKPYNVQIIKDNLSEQEARELETKLIRDCNYISNLKYEVWGKRFVNLKEIADNPRCRCSHARLKNRMNLGWSLQNAVLPPFCQGYNINQKRGSNGKFCPSH